MYFSHSFIEGKLLLIIDTAFLFLLTSDLPIDSYDIINTISIVTFIFLYICLVFMELNQIINFYHLSIQSQKDFEEIEAE